MAGGKLTPRQKMINMMYLVLTAMLALNVSAEILKSFDLIAESLRQGAEKIDRKNEQSATAIKDAVEKELKNNNTKNKDLIAAADKLRAETAKVVEYIEARKQDMYGEDVGRKDEATGAVAKPDETEKNYVYWMRKDPATGEIKTDAGRGNGRAKEMRDILNGYTKFASQMYADYTADKEEQKRLRANPKFPELAIDPKNDAKDKSDHATTTTTWEYNIFHGVPVAANIAMLEKFKNDVKVIESDVFEALRSRLQQVDFKIDSLIAMDAPTSQVVAAGMPFETQIFVTMSSKQIKPRFVSGSGGFKLSADGNSATMRVNANGSVIPAGKSEGEQGYTAIVEVPKTDGTMQRLSINKRFKVRKPVVQITSAAIQIMYQKCGNDVNIDVPALGDLYNPKIAASDAQVIQAPGNIRKFRIVPNGTKTTLNVKTLTNGQLIDIDNIPYQVIPPPKPSIVAIVDGKPWDGTSPIRAGAQVEVRVVPERNFLNSLRADAKYQIVGLKVKSGPIFLPPSAVTTPVSSDATPKPAEYAAASVRVPRDLPAGNKVFIEMDRINRINFKNDQVEEKFTIRELTLASIIKN